MFCCKKNSNLRKSCLLRLHKMIWLSGVLKILKCFLFHYHQLSPIFLNSNSLTSDKTNLNVEAIWLTDQSQGPWGNLKAEPALICVHGQEVQRPRAEPSKIIERGDEKVRDRRSFWELRPTLGAFCDRLLRDVQCTVDFCLASFLFISNLDPFAVQSSNGLLFLFAVCLLRTIQYPPILRS